MSSVISNIYNVLYHLRYFFSFVNWYAYIICHHSSEIYNVIGHRIYIMLSVISDRSHHMSSKMYHVLSTEIYHVISHLRYIMSCHLRYIISSVIWDISCHLSSDICHAICHLRYIILSVTWDIFCHLSSGIYHVLCHLRYIMSSVIWDISFHMSSISCHLRYIISSVIYHISCHLSSEIFNFICHLRYIMSSMIWDISHHLSSEIYQIIFPLRACYTFIQVTPVGCLSQALNPQSRGSSNAKKSSLQLNATMSVLSNTVLQQVHHRSCQPNTFFHVDGSLTNKEMSKISLR